MMRHLIVLKKLLEIEVRAERIFVFTLFVVASFEQNLPGKIASKRLH